MQLMVETKEHRADLHISGDITKGFAFFGMSTKQETDVSYNDVAEALKDLPDDVTEIGVHINSYGGEVAEGVAIYNALRSHHAKVTTVCEGFACSIASVIFMAGDERIMRDSSLLMLHNAAMPAHGDANAHRKAADDLDVITELSKTAYLNHAKGDLTREKLTEIMDAETWITPDQALEWGLATEVDKPAGDDEPTQSARALVMRQLTQGPRTKVIAQVNFTQEQVDEVVSRILAQIVQKDDEDDDDDEKPDTDDADKDADTDDSPDKDDDTDEDEDKKKKQAVFARISQHFKNLATSTNE